MFEGFSEEMVDFFLGIKLNNDKAWFEAHRGQYERDVRAPMLGLIDGLVPVLQEIDPQFDSRPGRIMARIYRDTRFSKDKSPYRDHLWLTFRYAEERLGNACCFYFSVSATESSWGCGFYQADRSVMNQLRAFCAHTPSKVLEVLEHPAFQSRFALDGEDYKRMVIPESVPEALHGLYRKKSIFAYRTLEDWPLLYRPELLDLLREDYKALAPFYTLLRDCTLISA